MPRNIRRFEWLMYSAIAVEILTALLRLDSFPGIVDLTNMAAINHVRVYLEIEAIFAFLTWLTARRRKNWARWVLTVLLGVWISGTVHNEPPYYGLHPIATIVIFASLFMAALAIYFTFTGDAPAWFDSKNKETRA